MPLLNYTTTVDASTTALEIQSKLVSAGARSFQVEYDSIGQPTAIAFRLNTSVGDQLYLLPANDDGVFRVLTRQADAGQVGRRFVTRTHAQRVAWRILKDWIEAQLAIVQAGMVTLDTVMLPYMLTPAGQTISELYAARRLALPAARASAEPGT